MNFSPWLFPMFTGLLVKTSLIFLLAWGLSWLVRKMPAANRCLIWNLAVYAVVLLPLISWGLPDWRLGLLPGTAELAMATGLPASDGKPSMPMAERPAKSGLDAGSSGSSQASGPAAMPPPALTGNWRAGLPGWRALLLSLWLGVALWLLLRTGLAHRRAGGLVKAAHPLESGPWHDLMQELSQTMGLKQQVSLAISGAVSSPFTWGVRRPWVLLPEKARQWTRERVRLVLLHELAHIRRGDYLTHLVAQAAAAIWWFNPLSYLARNRLIREREYACDDAVLLHGQPATTYAQHLLDIAQSLVRRPCTAAVGMAYQTQLEGRLMCILDKNQQRQVRSNGFARICLAATLFLLLPLAAAEPGGKVSKKKAQPGQVGAAAQPAQRNLASSVSAHALPQKPRREKRAGNPKPQSLSAEQVQLAEDYDLRNDFSESDIRFIFARQMPLDQLQAYREEDLHRRFSIHDIHHLVKNRVGVKQLLAYRHAGLLDRYSAHDLAYLSRKKVDLAYLNELKQVRLLGRYSAHDAAYLYNKEVPVAFLMKLAEAGLVNRYSAHDAGYLHGSEVTVSYLMALAEAGMANRFSAHDAAYLAKKPVPVAFLENVQEAGLLQRYSAHDLTYLFKKEVPATFLSELDQIGLARRFSAHDASYLHSKAVALDFLEEVSDAELIHRYSAHDLAHLHKKEVPVSYLTELRQAGYVNRFSAHDAAHLHGESVPMAHLNTFKDEGLLRKISAHSLAYLYHNPVPFEFMHRLEDARLLHHFNGYEIHYMYQNGISLDEILAAKKAGKLDVRWSEERIHNLFPR